MKKSNKWFAAVGMILLALTLILQSCARGISGFATWYAHGIYSMIVGALGRISGVFPFSVVEMLLYILIVGGIVYAVRFVKEPLRLLSRTVFLCGILLFVYTCNCGINYSAMAFSEYVGLEPGEYTREELVRLCEFLTEKVNETAAAESYQDHKNMWRAESVRAMQAAAERISEHSESNPLAGYYPLPKPVTVSWILSVQQLCGVYSPFTIEANFNPAMPSYNIPHTLCHELSHLKGFMREDEANFVGYLACISSGEQAFQYSGYLTGWVYAGNALARVDMEAYARLREKLCEQARKDLAENNIFWDRYEGKVAEVSNRMNDTYLKINQQTDGVRSYGRMVDLMLAYRQLESE